MNHNIKTYKYLVEYIKRGKWVPVLQTDIEDRDTFELVANAEEYQYRIFQMILSWRDHSGKRIRKSISTRLPIKGNKKRAEEMLRHTCTAVDKDIF